MYVLHLVLCPTGRICIPDNILIIPLLLLPMILIIIVVKSVTVVPFDSSMHGRHK